MTKPNSAHSHPWKISDVVLFPILGIAIAAEYLWPTVIFGFPNWVAVVVGVGLIGFGNWLIGSCKAALDAADQPNLPGIPTTRLVTDGPFAYSRNPNYLGAITMACGIALIADSWWFWGGAVLGAAILDR